MQSVSTDELERQLHASLVERGRPATSIHCPDALDKREGEKVECTAIFPGLEQSLAVTFKGIDGDLNSVRIEAQPSRVTPYGLTNVLKTFLEQHGKPADFVDCPDALDADKGSRVECAVVRDNLGYAVTVSSNGPNGNDVDLRYDVGEKPNWWPRDWLARHVLAVLKQHGRGTPPDSADCPGKLDAKQGSKIECTFVEDGLESTATLTWNGAGIDLLTAAEPDRTTQEGLVTQVTRAVTARTGQRPDEVECPEQGLAAEVGQTQRCMVSTGADHYPVTVTVTSVEDGIVNYMIKRSRSPTD